jgi:hypothetical protein
MFASIHRVEHLADESSATIVIHDLGIVDETTVASRSD